MKRQNYICITYIQRNQVASFRQQNARKNIPGRATFQATIQEDDLHFYLKIHSPQTLSTHLTSKKQSPGFSTNGALEWVKIKIHCRRINL